MFWLVWLQMRGWLCVWFGLVANEGLVMCFGLVWLRMRAGCVFYGCLNSENGPILFCFFGENQI